jgi:hypothetical protein
LSITAFVVAIANQSLDPIEQLLVHRRLRPATIEDRHLMPAGQRAVDLVRPGEGGSAEDEYAQRRPRPGDIALLSARRDEPTHSEGAAHSSRRQQKLSSRARHPLPPFLDSVPCRPPIGAEWRES